MHRNIVRLPNLKKRLTKNTYDKILDKLINGLAKSQTQLPVQSSVALKIPLAPPRPQPPKQRILTRKPQTQLPTQLPVMLTKEFFIKKIPPAPPPPQPPKPKILSKKKRIIRYKNFIPAHHHSRPIVYRALRRYEGAEQVTSTSIVATNLQLKGITHIPKNFRQALLKHPDLSDLDNYDRLSTQEQKVALLFFVSKNSNLKDEIIQFNNMFWRIESDITKNKSNHEDQTSSIPSRSIVIRNTNDHHTIDIYEDYTLLDSKKMDSNTLFICKFKLHSRIIPFYDQYGILSGIELAFFELKTLKMTAEHDHTTVVKDKLCVGITSGSSSILYDSKEPEYEICSWCAESILTAAEVLIHRKDVAKKLGLSTVPSQHSVWLYNCRITYCAKSHELITMPRHSSTKNIIIIVDNYGYDINVHRDVLKFVDHLIKNKMAVKIIMPVAKYIGIKIKLNDILCKYGINSAANVMLEAVTINSTLDLEPVTQPLQALIQLIQLEEQLKTKSSDYYFISIKIIQLYRSLGKENVSKEYCEKIYCQLPKPPHEKSKILAQLHHEFGRIYYHKNELLVAKRHLFNALRLKKITGENLARLYLDIGLVYSEENDVQSASNYYKEALNAIKTKPTKNSNLELSKIYLALGDLYYKNDDFDRAKIYYQKNIHHCIIFFGDENYIELAKAQGKLGFLFFKQKDYSRALESYNKYMHIMQKIFSSKSFPKDVKIILHIAKTLLALGKDTDSLEYYIQLFQENEKHNLLNLILSRARRISSTYRVELLTTLSKESIFKRNKQVLSLIAEASSNNTLVMIRPENLSKIKHFPNMVVIDIEATGLGRKQHITEIACIKMENYKITGEFFHRYVNPGQQLNIGARMVTGLTDTFLGDFRKFSDVAEEFLEFIEGAALLMHDAPSDLLYLNAELRRMNHKCKTLEDYHPIIDSLELAKSLHPDEKNNLNALCDRYGIDTAGRTQKSGHGALLDALLLAKVYSAMIQGETIIEERPFGCFCKI